MLVKELIENLQLCNPEDFVLVPSGVRKLQGVTRVTITSILNDLEEVDSFIPVVVID